MLDPEVLTFFERWNARDFYACHEVLEKRWLTLPAQDPRRAFYKGLIQAAAAFHLLSRRRLPGARKLLASATAHLEVFRPTHQGLDVSGFCLMLAEWRLRLERTGEIEIAPAELPVLQLQACEPKS